MIIDQMLNQLQDEQHRVSTELQKIQAAIKALDELKSVQDSRGLQTFELNGSRDFRLQQ